MASVKRRINYNKEEGQHPYMIEFFGFVESKKLMA